MSRTGIEYLDESWNLTAGCSHAGPGCTHCYAERMTHRLAANPVTRGQYAGLTDEQGRWTGLVVSFLDRLDRPLHWRKPRVIGVDFLADLFHADVPADFIGSAYYTMARATQHIFVVCTKRPAGMRTHMLSPYGASGRPPLPLPHVYLGASVSTQANLDEAAPHLAALAAAGWRTWLSCEPLLGWMDIDEDLLDCLNGVIVGAETGPGARPCKAEWVESIVAPASRAGVACYVKKNAPPRVSGAWPRQTPWEAAR